MEFKVGDRVKSLLSSVQDNGVIVMLNFNSTRFLIQFDNWNKGHNGGGDGYKLTNKKYHQHHYWLSTDELELENVNYTEQEQELINLINKSKQISNL